MKFGLFLLPIVLATASILPENKLQKRGLRSLFSSIFGSSKGFLYKQSSGRMAVFGDDAAKEAAKAVNKFYGKQPPGSRFSSPFKQSGGRHTKQARSRFGSLFLQSS
jgi:hypothetical protein